MNENNKNDYPDPDDIDTTNVVSSTECTGLVRGLPDDEDQMEAFTEIYDIPEQGDLGILKNALDIVMERQKMQEKDQKIKMEG